MRKEKKSWWKEPAIKEARRTEEQLCSLVFWQSNDTVPGSCGSWPRTAWEQMEYSMFLSENEEVREKESKSK